MQSGFLWLLGPIAERTFAPAKTAADRATVDDPARGGAESFLQLVEGGRLLRRTPGGGVTNSVDGGWSPEE